MKKKILVFTILLVAILSYFLIKNFYHDPNVYAFKSQFYTWAGDTRVITPDSANISAKQLDQLRSLVKPGDFFLNRSDYYISNIGIPGFWTHAGFYVGSPDELDDFFKGDKKCSDWAVSMGEDSGVLSQLLEMKFGGKYNRYLGGNLWLPIIESLSEGVVFSSYADAVTKDGIVVLRPKVSKFKIAKAVYQAFELVDRPYDFDFDFSSDSLIACTELIHCIYKDSKLFSIGELFGKPFVTANEIAQHYDSNYENSKIKMIYLFDGEKSFLSGSAEGTEIFRKSWEDSFW